jgi:hypothetical protein
MCREVMVRREALRGQAGTSLRGLEGESSVDLNLRLVTRPERMEREDKVILPMLAGMQCCGTGTVVTVTFCLSGSGSGYGSGTGKDSVLHEVSVTVAHFLP